MKAIVLSDYGPPEALRYEDAPAPNVGADDALVKLAATSVNPIDWKMRSGAAKERFPLQFPAILGRDLAGTVLRTGANVRNLNPGQIVIGLATATYAEEVAVRAEYLTVLPDGLAVEDSAALPLVTTTGAQLIQRMQPKQGDVVLVTGALGSVARTAVYVAKSRGARVIAGVKTEQKEQAASLGADEVVAVDNDEEVRRLPDLDAIADTVDHDIIGKLIPKLKTGAVLGSVLGKPKEAEGRDIRVEAFMASPDASLLRQMADAVRDQRLAIPIARRMHLSQAAEAHALAENGSVGGKILLVP